MAGMDYGVIVFENGLQRFKDEPFLSTIDLKDGTKIQFYKCHFKISTGAGEEITIHGTNDEYGKNRKSFRFVAFGRSFHVRQLCEGVYRLKFTDGSDHFTVIYGYGIDHRKKVWDKTKYLYLGKRNAKIADREIAKAKTKHSYK